MYDLLLPLPSALLCAAAFCGLVLVLLARSPFTPAVRSFILMYLCALACMAMVCLRVLGVAAPFWRAFIVAVALGMLAAITLQHLLNWKKIRSAGPQGLRFEPAVHVPPLPARAPFTGGDNQPN